MIQAEKLEHVLDRKGLRVTKPESSENLDSIDVLRSDNLKGFKWWKYLLTSPQTERIQLLFNKKKKKQISNWIISTSNFWQTGFPPLSITTPSPTIDTTIRRLRDTIGLSAGQRASWKRWRDCWGWTAMRILVISITRSCSYQPQSGEIKSWTKININLPPK